MKNSTSGASGIFYKNANPGGGRHGEGRAGTRKDLTLRYQRIHLQDFLKMNPTSPPYLT